MKGKKVLVKFACSHFLCRCVCVPFVGTKLPRLLIGNAAAAAQKYNWMNSVVKLSGINNNKLLQLAVLIVTPKNLLGFFCLKKLD